MRIILLNQHRYTTVDDEDYDRLNQYKWYAKTIHNTTYACRAEGKKTIYLHKMIITTEPNEVVDHIDQQGLNNCRANLRSITTRNNLINCKLRPNKKSKYRGVSKSRTSGYWIARICSYGVTEYLGSYHDETIAAKQYDKKAEELFGEFAILNFPAKTKKKRK